MFSVLYAVWALPETILVRHICLIAGALIGLYEIFHFRAILFGKLNSATIPVWMLVGLFAWASFHLFFLSNNFPLQMEEYSSIWKRTALGAIFAIGLGLALGGCDSQKQRAYWRLFYLGLLTPTLIYVLKYSLTHYGVLWGVNPPAYLKLHYGSHPFYLPKTAYVCFCLPALAAALGGLRQNIRNHVWLSPLNFSYALTIPAVLFVFYGENIKNGVVYGGFLILVFAGQLLLADFKRHWVRKAILTLAIAISGSVFVVNHVQKNESWRTLAADARVAVDINRYEQWRFNGQKGYPDNELGKMVSATNYERIAWGKVGVILLSQNPLGYGLIERSFGRLSKQAWPDSSLHQSHSGWLDLALGIGIPGMVLLLGGLLLNMYQLRRIAESGSGGMHSPTPGVPWPTACWWILLASLVMWFTTEISQKVFFDSLIFWVALASGLVARSGLGKFGP